MNLAIVAVNASFKLLAREFGREEDTWENLGI